MTDRPDDQASASDPPAVADGAEAAPESPQQAKPVRYVHTESFPRLLTDLGVSLVVTTYQAGKLIVIRGEGTKCSILMRNFPQPMGVAVASDRIALGTSSQVWTFRSAADIAAQLDPPGRHDGCYVPRSSHVTGDIRVHELGYLGKELWVVNTRFSCLCTLEPNYSFVPRWRPAFVSELVAEDRCHLNGMAIADDRIRYVTAMGETDSRADWRANRASGGIVIDVPRGQIVARGLSMPHSPRVYRDRLWVLNSGWGTLCAVDPEGGAVDSICTLPGFTRGLAFADRFAFVGLSKIREKRAFGGVPIEERAAELQCAVYAVDIETGDVAGYMLFESGSEELFDVQVLAGMRWPSIIGLRRDSVGGIFLIPKGP